MRAVIATALCVALTGCANFNSISRTRISEWPAQVHYADAQQWGVLSQRWPSDRVAKEENGKKEYAWAYRSCAQPSPDVFTVLGYSAAAGMSRDKNADGKALNAELATALSQTGSTISRTQTVNLLRESMYRTCERFMNGAMTQQQFLVQAARDQRAMVAIMAIEQLTGVVLPQPTIISASGMATRTDRPLEVLATLEDAEKKEKSARNAAEAAKTIADDTKNKYTEINKVDTANKDGICEALIAFSEKPVTTPPTPPPAATPATTTPALADCKAKKEARDKAAADAKKASDAQTEAKAHLDDVRAIIGGGPGGSAARTSVDGTPGSAVGPASASDRAAVANVVQHIVDNAFSDTSELVFICMDALNVPNSANGKLQDACVELYKNKANAEAAKARDEAASYGQKSVADQVVVISGQFDAVALNAMNGDSVVKAKVDALVAAAKVLCGDCFQDPEALSQFQKATNRQELRGGFVAFTPQEQRMLARLAEAR